MYVPTYFDFVNLTTLYLPFICVVLFSDIAILDKLNETEEIIYMSSRKPVPVFLQRYLLSLGVFLGYITLANVIFRGLQHFRGDTMIEPISFLEYIAIVGGGSLFIGGMAMFISAAFNNIYVGYGFSSMYWIYWNVNCQTEAVINPFPFIASPTFYELPLIIVYGFSAALITLTCLLANKSPYYISDKLRKLIFTSR
jgi:hypothetical protein